MIDFDFDTAVQKCLIKDRFFLRKQYRELSSLPEDKQQAKLESLLKRMLDSQAVVEGRESIKPTIEYPDLPVSDKREDIKALISEHQVVIVAGETGSGKTTQLPKMCLELGRGVYGQIGHTQPRRLAARSVANRIAEECQQELGSAIGYKVRFNDVGSDASLVKLMTDGILLAEIQQDRFLNKYDTIIIDEAHERSLNIDFLLGYLKQILPKRPDLKVIITSATIEPERFSKHFNDAPVIEVSGRTYPVEVRYMDPADEEEPDTLEMLKMAIQQLSRESNGDILVFLPGERDIRDAQQELSKEKLGATEILPLYSRLSNSEQNKIFSTGRGRRIILSTNVAETSLTVPGIKYVIDTGLARISRYSARSKVQRLPIEAISQASANQRSGRCGRTSNGIAIRLYSEADYNSRSEFTDPEILRTHLSSVILQMLALGLGNIQKFPFVQSPDDRQINDGIKLLEELNAITRKQGKLILTPIGRKMAKLPLDPRYARMIIEAQKYNSTREVIVITAGLSVQDPRERPQDKQQKADEAHSQFTDKNSDFISLLNVWTVFKQRQNELSNSQLRKWCKQNFIHYMRMREWQDIVSQIKQSLSDLDLHVDKSEADYEAIHRAICVGLLSQLGLKDKNKEYLGSRNLKFLIFPGSGVSKSAPKWLMTAELVETSKLFARQVAKISPDWLESCSAHLSKRHFDEPHWSKKSGSAQAYLTVTLFGLPIVQRRKQDYSRVDPNISRELFIREGLVNGETNLKYAFLKKNQSLMSSIELLEKKSRRRDIMVDEDTLCDFYEGRIDEKVCNEATFKKWWQQASSKTPELLNFDYDSLLKRDASSVTANAYPDVWRQGQLTLPLTYHFEPTDPLDGVAVNIPVSVLNQVHPVGFDWLVPGMRHELFVNLIKCLPKRLRRNFVPAPDYAQACLNDIQDTDKNGAPISVLKALSEKLFKMSGTRVLEEDFELENLSKHLRFNFIIVDNHNKKLASGKDLAELKKSMQGKVQAKIEEVASDSLEQEDISDFPSAELPAVFKQKQAGFEISGFPALVVNKNGVDVKVLEDKQKADIEHAKGLARLIKNNIPSPVKYLQQKLPNKAKLSLYFNPFGQIQLLIDDLILAAIEALIAGFANPEDIRSKDQYRKALEICRMNVNDKTLEIAVEVEKGLATANAIQKKCKGKIPLNVINQVGNVQSYLDQLVFKGFVQNFGVEKLEDWNRYLNALLQRAEKLMVDPNRDRLNQIELDKAEQALQKALEKRKKLYLSTEPFEEVKWMIEEFKISLFAQQLGTRFPISLKRISNKINQLEQE